jgi:hypothetical protein
MGADTTEEDRPGDQREVHDHHESEEQTRLADGIGRVAGDVGELLGAGVGTGVGVEREGTDEHDCDEGADDAGDPALARAEQAELAPHPGQQADHSGGDRERPDRAGSDRGRNQVSPDQIRQYPGERSREWAGQYADQDRPYRV